MPNRFQPFIEDSYYHVFNRGVEKRTIFQEEADYFTFCEVLSYYLNTSHTDLSVLLRTGEISRGIFDGKIKLLSYSLMPNHFHLLLHQTDQSTLSNFMQRTSTAYAMYFNRKYHRVGSLFQGRFKAKLIDTDEYLLQVNKYIHRNALPITRSGLVNYPWSSYPKYLNSASKSQILYSVLDTETILQYFNFKKSPYNYKMFVENIPLEEEIMMNISRF